MLFLVCNHVIRRPCWLTRQQTFFKYIIILFVVSANFCISIVFNFSWDLQSPEEKLVPKTFGGTTKGIRVFLKKAYTFFFAEFALKSVQFPAKRNAYVRVNQHGRRDVICKPAVPKKSKTIDIITLFNLVTLMPRITGFYYIKHFHSSLCTFFSTSGSRRLRYYRSA